MILLHKLQRRVASARPQALAMISEYGKLTQTTPIGYTVGVAILWKVSTTRAAGQAAVFLRGVGGMEDRRWST
jgi:hypothetical protein